MDNKRILLVDLAVGKVGEDVSALLGAMMITKIQLSAMQRANIPEEQRQDFYLYVDEFQNFATESFATILSEARKYRLSLIMTNQYIAQMPEVVRDAVFGNIGTLVSFRVGATDAAFLVKEYEPVFDANDLVNLDNYHIYTKMAINGVTSNAFSAKTLAPKTERFPHRDDIIGYSHKHYSQDRGKVEGKMLKWQNSLIEEGVEEHKKDTQKGQEYSEKIKELGYKKIKSLTGKTWYIKESQIPNLQSQSSGAGDTEKKNENENEKSIKLADTGQPKSKVDKSFFDLNRWSKPAIMKNEQPQTKNLETGGQKQELPIMKNEKPKIQNKGDESDKKFNDQKGGPQIQEDSDALKKLAEVI